MSDRIVVFQHGHVEQIGTSQQIYDEPQSAFVTEFVGLTNCIKGLVEDASVRLVSVEGHLVQTLASAINSGDPVDMWIRPKRIRFQSFGDKEGKGNILPDHIEDSVFLGSKVSVRAKAGTQHFTVDWPRNATRPLPENGRAVGLVFSADIPVSVPLEQPALP